MLYKNEEGLCECTTQRFPSHYGKKGSELYAYRIRFEGKKIFCLEGLLPAV